MRLSYTKNGSGTEIIEENNYYPFGLKYQGYNTLTGNSAYKYQYNGKELQQETGWSDFGARMYMADLGRWGVIDPLAETSRRFTPYNYAYNNPISFIDPDGRKARAVDESWSWNVSADSGWFITSGSERRKFGSLDEFVEKTSGKEKGGGGSMTINSTLGFSLVKSYLERGYSVDEIIDILKFLKLPVKEIKGHLMEWFKKAKVKPSGKPEMSEAGVSQLLDKVPQLMQLFKESGSFPYKVDPQEELSFTNEKTGLTTYGWAAFENNITLGSTIIHETGHALDITMGVTDEFRSLIKDKGLRDAALEYRMYEYELRYSLPEYNKSGVNFRNIYYDTLVRVYGKNPDIYIK